MKTVIKVGSVTSAQRAVNVLKSSGCNAQISRLENPSAGDGCGYVVVVPSECKAIDILNRNKVRILGVEEN